MKKYEIILIRGKDRVMEYKLWEYSEKYQSIIHEVFSTKSKDKFIININLIGIDKSKLSIAEISRDFDNKKIKYVAFHNFQHNIFKLMV